MQLLEIIKITGAINVINGLHIGAGNENIEIGGLDNAVIRNPRTHEPYIPGSSIKGKMRFLTEWKENAIKNENPHECDNPDCAICRIFGSLKNSEKYRGPGRLIVRDAFLEQDYDPESMLEVKYSTAIDRITGTAKIRSLRNMERVTPGTKFKFEICYRVVDTDDAGAGDYNNLKSVINAMSMLEKDTLGGSGSRGCGKIAFENISITSSKVSKQGLKTTGELAEVVEGAL